MKIVEIVENIELTTEGIPSRKRCLSKVPNSKMSASELSSCISRGLRARITKKKFTIGGKRMKIKGKKVKGEKYGGEFKNYTKPH